MYNDTYKNILVSYAYLYSNKDLISYLKNQTSNGNINLMLDSGAFTARNAKSDFSHVNVDTYCSFLEDFEPYPEKYVMLDVIGNATLSRKNYEIMINRGLKPMFVMTMYDKDYNYLRETLKINKNICVAGGANTKGPWLIKRFQDVFIQSNKEAKIHGLAFVTYPNMLRLPLASVDSSSWNASAARFGLFQYWNNGIKQFWYRDILYKGKKLKSNEKSALDRIKITPQMYANPENHRGSNSIETLSNLQAHITMQKICKKKGLNYFLAVGGLSQLNRIMYVYENYNDLSYEKFVKYFAV